MVRLLIMCGGCLVLNVGCVMEEAIGATLVNRLLDIVLAVLAAGGTVIPGA